MAIPTPQPAFNPDYHRMQQYNGYDQLCPQVPVAEREWHPYIDQNGQQQWTQDLPPGYDDLSASTPAYQRPPTPPPAVQAVARRAFSWTAALLAGLTTLAFTAALDFPFPFPLIVSLLAGGVFGFLAAKEPTARVVHQQITPQITINHWWGSQWIPATWSERVIITDWTNVFSSFLRLLVIARLVSSEQRRPSRTVHHTHTYTTVPPLGRGVNRGWWY